MKNLENEHSDEIKALTKLLRYKEKEIEKHRDRDVCSIINDEIGQLREDLAWKLLDCQEYKKALALYEKLSWKRYGEIKYLGMVRALTEMGQYDEAARLIEKGIRRFPESYSLIVGKGNLYHSMGDYAKSSKYFHQAMQINSSNPFIAHNCGCALYGLGYYEDALPIFQRLTREYPGERMFSVMMGYSFLNTGHAEEAIKCFKTIAGKTQPDPEIYNGLYWAYDDLGLAEDAIKIAQTALKRFPVEDEVLYMNMAQAYWNKGWLNEARDIVKKGIGIFPDNENLRELLKKIEDDMDNPDNGGHALILSMIKVIAMSAMVKRWRYAKKQ